MKKQKWKSEVPLEISSNRDIYHHQEWDILDFSFFSCTGPPLHHLHWHPDALTTSLDLVDLGY